MFGRALPLACENLHDSKANGVFVVSGSRLCGNLLGSEKMLSSRQNELIMRSEDQQFSLQRKCLACINEQPSKL